MDITQKKFKCYYVVTNKRSNIDTSKNQREGVPDKELETYKSKNSENIFNILNNFLLNPPCGAQNLLYISHVTPGT